MDKGIDGIKGFVDDDSGIAASAGFFTSEHFGKFPRIQILTIEELLAGKTLQMPPSLERTFKQAERVETETDDQGSLTFK